MGIMAGCRFLTQVAISKGFETQDVAQKFFLSHARMIGGDSEATRASNCINCIYRLELNWRKSCPANDLRPVRQTEISAIMQHKTAITGRGFGGRGERSSPDWLAGAARAGAAGGRPEHVRRAAGLNPRGAGKMGGGGRSAAIGSHGKPTSAGADVKSRVGMQ